MKIYAVFYYNRLRGVFVSQEEAELAARDIYKNDPDPNSEDWRRFGLMVLDLGSYQKRDKWNNLDRIVDWDLELPPR